MMLVRRLHPSAVIAAIALTVLTGCPGGTDIDPSTPDAHVPHHRDAGFEPMDAATERDAGFVTDASVPRDAGFRDGGTEPYDGGRDAGVEDPEPPILVEHAGGRTETVELYQGLAYVGVGPRLTIWDVTQQPARLGQSEALSGLVSAIAPHGDYTYVTTVDSLDSHLHVIDTSTIGHPVEVGVMRLGNGTYSRLVATLIDGTRLYVSDAEHGIYILDLADPARPVVQSMIETYHVVDLRVHGSRLLAVSNAFNGQRAVEAFDTTTFESLGRANLGVVGSELLPGGLLLTRGHNGATVEDLASLPSLTRLYTSPAVPIYASAADEDGVWLNPDGQLRRLDLSNPAAIVASPSYGTGIWALTAGAAEAGRLVFVDYQGMVEAFDITSGATSLGETHTGPCAYCYSATTWGQRIAVTETAPGAVGAVGVLRADDLTLLGRHWELDTDFEEVVVDGDVAYVADWFTGLWAFDISDATNPTVIATVPTAGYPTALTFAGPYVVVGEGTNGGSIRVFSTGGRDGPTELGSHPSAFVRDIEGSGTHVFVAASALGLPGGLYVYDVADPTNIQLVAYASDCDSGVGVAIEGTRLVVACEDGVHVYDISVPAAPVPLGRWTAGSDRTGGPVALAGDRFFVALLDGVSVVDISNPALPTLVEVLETSWLPWNLTVGRGRVVAATYAGGVYQWPSRAPPR
jgi:hypothetical protein